MRRSIVATIIAMIMMIVFASCANKQEILSNNENNSINIELENKISSTDMINTIKDISLKPRPINSTQIEVIKEYIVKKFELLGYNKIEYQKFEYNDEQNEYAIRRSSQEDVFLSSTVNNAPVDGTGTNIIIEKTSLKDTYNTLIISAHYDSSDDSFGVNDNGSGVAIVFELAKILKDVELPFNIQFVMFSGEEKYMLGSRYYVSKLSENEKDDIIGVINIDTVAEKSDLGYFVMVSGDRRNKNQEYENSDIQEIAELNKNLISEMFVDDDKFKLTMAMNSDHYPFSLVGIPAVSIVQNWDDGLKVNDSSDIINNIEPLKLVEVAKEVLKVILTIK